MGAAVEESRARPSKQGNNAGLVVDKNTNGGDSEVSNKKLNMDSRSMSLIQKSSCSKPQMSLLSNKSVKVQHYREDPVMFVNVKCDAVERDNR